METAQSDRHAGIELGRIIAISLVVYIHTRGEQHSYLGNLMNMVATFAVAYFFVVSGYFFSNNSTVENPKNAKIIKLFRIFTPLTFFWFALYSIIPSNWLYAITHHEFTYQTFITISNSVGKFSSSPINFIFDGPPLGFHLWFLPSLLSATVLLYFFLYFRAHKIGLIFAFCLFIIGLLFGSYQNSPLGYMVNFNMRNGPFQSFVLFYSGWYIGKISKKPGFIVAYTLLFVGVTVSYFEGKLLAQFNPPPPSLCGYYACVLPIGLGSFIFFNNIKSPPLYQLWIKLGSLSLYIYLLHILLRDPIVSILYKYNVNYSPYLLLISLFTVSLLTSILISEATKLFKMHKDNILHYFNLVRENLNYPTQRY